MVSFDYCFFNPSFVAVLVAFSTYVLNLISIWFFFLDHTPLRRESL